MGDGGAESARQAAERGGLCHESPLVRQRGGCGRVVASEGAMPEHQTEELRERLCLFETAICPWTQARGVGSPGHK
jgi:hypothetical protein